MSIVDGLPAVGAALFAVCAVVAGQFTRRMAPIAIPVLIAGCLAQLLIEQFYWQFVPLYILIAASAGLVVAQAKSARRWPILLARCGIGLLALTAMMPLLMVPVPSLPRPSGPYAVGTSTFRWVDEQRPEHATERDDDRRNVVVQAWYPAEAGARGPHSRYLDGQGRLPRTVSLLPSPLMRGYGRIDTHAIVDAPVHDARTRWPVVLFSPGYGAPRAFYTGLITDLASRGFVVLAVDHPYEVAVTELADGRIATAVEQFAGNDADGERYMSEQLDVRRDDLRFVVDQLGRPEVFGPRLSARLDTEHIAAIGHSYGGAAAAAALAADPRIRAAANIDGTLYGTLPEQSLDRPFLLVQSDFTETGHSPQFVNRNQALIDRLRGGGFRYEIRNANHYSFTDVPRFVAAPGRALMAQFIGGARGDAETQRATNDILAAFLRGPLDGQPGDIAAAVSGHRGISGGPVP